MDEPLLEGLGPLVLRLSKYERERSSSDLDGTNDTPAVTQTSFAVKRLG